MKNTAKTRKKRSPVGIIFLVVLLILAGAAGYLYYTIVKAPLTLDDPEKMAASRPMDAQDRFAIVAEDKSVQVKLEAADFWTVILSQSEADVLEVLNRELSGYDLSVSGCAIAIDEAGLRLDLELFYQEIRLVARIPCNLEFTGNKITMTPAGVTLGQIPLPVEDMLPDIKLEFKVDVPVVDQVTDVSYVSGAVVLEGSVKEGIQEVIPSEDQIYRAVLFDTNMKSIADELFTDAGFSALTEKLQKNPGNVEDLYRQLFLLAGVEETAAYVESSCGLTQRFFPGIDLEVLNQDQLNQTEFIREQTLTLEKFFNKLVNEYNDKKFTLSKGQFTLKGKEFHAAKYGSGDFDSLFAYLNPEEVFLVLVNTEDSFIRNTSSFYRMAKEGLEFTKEVDYNKTYILGCVLRSVEGKPFLMYEKHIDREGGYSRGVKLIPLTEEQVSQMHQPDKIGVWSD